MKKQLLLFFALFGIFFMLKAQSPVVAYHFHNGTYYDIGGLNFHPNLIAPVGSAIDAFGNPNSAAQIDGGYLDIGDKEELEFANGAITISAWVLTEPISDWTALVNKWQNGVGGYYLGINPANNFVRFNVLVDNVEDTAPIPFNEWVHYVASYDGTTIKLYRNGVLANQKVAPGALAGNTTSFRIGRQSDVASSVFNGSIDEVLVYGEALSDDAIGDLYTNGTQIFGNDVAMVTMDVENFLIAPANIDVKGKLFNVGTETVTSFDLHWSDGTNTFSQPISGVNIEPYEVYDYAHSDNLALAAGDTKNLTVWAENPNGMADENEVNNSVSGSVLGVGFVPQRRVFVEEGTGTWCGWCPRGTVGLNYMTENYPDDFIGVAFHNGDPIVIDGYEPGFFSFPDARLDRKISLDPGASELEVALLARLEEFTLASIGIQGTYVADTRELTATLSSQFALPSQGDYRFNLIIVEDGVTGTGAGYAQINYFAGGGNGVMGGYENLPSPVPADQMVYDHVARAVLGDYDGTAGSLPADIAVSQNYEYTYNYTLPVDYDESEIHVVALIIDVNGNEVVNAISTPLLDLLSNDKEAFLADNVVKVFPNPTSDMTNIKLDLEESANVSLTVLNAVGQAVANREYGILSGEMMLPFYTQDLSEGMYFIHVKVDDKIAVRKLVVSKR